MEKYFITNLISVVVSVVLLITFYILLAAGLVTELKSFLTPLVLIVIAVILVAIFTTLTKMEYDFRAVASSTKKK